MKGQKYKKDNKIMEINKIYLGDCLELMPNIKTESVNMILCDLPYGTTACKWDTIIPFDKLWEQYERIIKPNGVIVLTASQPFTSALVMSNVKLFKYDWSWHKSTSAGFIQAKNRPMRRHEDVLVFSKGSMGHKSLLAEDKRMVYEPQGLVKVDKIHKRPSTGAVNVIGARKSHKKEFKVEYENYPNTILSFKIGNNKNVHPTQKPVELFEYLIKTYTYENDLVLDNCIGSGTTAIACKRTGRNFIGIEKEQKYFDIANKRLNEELF